MQIAGGIAVLAAAVWVQSHRADLDAEAAPDGRRLPPDRGHERERATLWIAPVLRWA